MVREYIDKFNESTVMVLTCVDRLRDVNGNIIKYVFEGGKTLDAKIVKSRLEMGEVIQGLKLTKDNRIIFFKGCYFGTRYYIIKDNVLSE